MNSNMDELGTFKVKVVTAREHEEDIDDTQINHMIWITFMKSITWMKLNFVNDHQNIDEVDNMDDEKYHMDEITFLNQNYHPYVNLCECDIYIFISLQIFLLSY